MRHPSFVAGSLYLVFLLTSCSKPSSTEPVVRPAIVEHPSVFQAAVSETYAGQTRPRHESTLSFRVSGKIQARSVEVGHHVRQGQVLASLDSGDYRLQVEAAQAALGAAQAELNLAKSEFDRHADLLSKKMISQAFYEVRENAWKAAQSRVTQARSMLQASRNQEDYAQLRADADGVVTAVLVEVGQVVLSGTPVIELAQDGDVEVALSVSENRISGLKLKQLVWTEFWALPGQRFQERYVSCRPWRMHVHELMMYV